MAVYNETTSGGAILSYGLSYEISYYMSADVQGLTLGFSSDVTLKYNFTIKFKPGSTVYNKKKANLGIIEKLTIKKARLFPFEANKKIPGSISCRNCDYATIYADTFNSFHNEEDLCSLEDAISLVETALAVQASSLESEMSKGNIEPTEQIDFREEENPDGPTEIFNS